MKPNFKFSFFSFIFVFLLLFASNFAIPKVKEKTNFPGIKRGAILDRNYEPIAISAEFYKAYYLVKDRFFGQKLSPSVSKYLPSLLELPKKGLVLLTDKLDLKEVEVLKKEKNVFVESYYVRDILQPCTKFLIGEVVNDFGISGLEKIFNDVLKDGNWIRISLDMKLQKNLCDKFEETKSFSAVVVDLKSGEFLAYLDLPENSYFTQLFPVSDFNLSSEEISSFRWELGEIKPVSENSQIKITPLHILKWFFNKICNNNYDLTILPRTPICQHSTEVSFKFPLSFFSQNKILYLDFKKNKLIMLITEIEKDYKATLSYLKYLAHQIK